jgi:hypothetical protein
MTGKSKLRPDGPNKAGTLYHPGLRTLTLVTAELPTCPGRAMCAWGYSELYGGKFWLKYVNRNCPLHSPEVIENAS